MLFLKDASRERGAISIALAAINTNPEIILGVLLRYFRWILTHQL